MESSSFFWLLFCFFEAYIVYSCNFTVQMFSRGWTYLRPFITFTYMDSMFADPAKHQEAFGSFSNVKKYLNIIMIYFFGFRMFLQKYFWYFLSKCFWTISSSWLCMQSAPEIILHLISNLFYFIYLLFDNCSLILIQ